MAVRAVRTIVGLTRDEHKKPMAATGAAAKSLRPARASLYRWQASRCRRPILAWCWSQFLVALQVVFFPTIFGT
jgi:hypothetical protein